MFTRYKISLQNIFSLILILVIVLSITTLSIFNYSKTKQKLYTHLEETSQITLKRLSNSLAPFIESYSLEEYKNLIKNEMNDPDIFAIIIQDHHMGNILGKNSFYIGIIRDPNWKIVEYKDTHKDTLQTSFLQVNAQIDSSLSSNLGKVTIYYTDKFIKHELSQLIYESIFAILFISTVILFVLFITLNKFILNPIFTIVNGLKKTDTYGLPIKQLPNLPTMELSNLSSKINAMIHEIQSSRSTLDHYIERYELTINGINDGIWDWNIKDNTVYFSKRWKSILGYEEDEFDNTPEAFFNALHEKDKEKAKLALQKHFENPEKNIFYIEMRIRSKNGSYKWILSRGKAILDENKEPIRMVGSHTDISDKKLEEKKSEQLLKQLQLAKKIGKLGIWEIEYPTNTSYWSSEFYKQMGLDKSVSPSYENFLNRIYPEDKAYIEQKHKESLENQGSYQELEFRFLLDDQTVRYVKAFSSTLYDENKKPLKGIGVIYDVTEIQRERSFISTIIDNANAVIAVIDSNGIMFRVNRYTEEFTGYTQKEISSEPYFWSCFLPNTQKSSILQIIEKAKQGEIVKFFKNSWFSKNGEQRVFEWSNTLVKKVDGTMDYIATIGIDVTKREKIQTLILEQKQEFESIFKYSKDGIAITDLETNFLDCNDAYLEITGYTKEQLLKQSCTSLTVPEERKKSKEIIEKVKESGHVENFEKACIVKDGKRINTNMSISLLPDKKRFLIVTKDVTSIKLFEEQSKLASMGEMIGNIAHQWRQPLSIITTSATGMKLRSQMGKLNQEVIDEYSDLVVQQAQYLSNTIDNFRDFIKGDTKYEYFNISNLIKQSISLMEASLKNNYIHIILSIDEDIQIYGNINELTQVLLNILTNAKDALKENIAQEQERLIFITTHKIEDHSIEILIKDNAGGISPDIINRIFEPYFTTKHQSMGTGLGLSMVDKIIRERHHQAITVYNDEFEYNNQTYKGACFKILFKT